MPVDRASPGWRHLFESATATCVDLLARVFGEGVAPREVRFLTSAPVPAGELERFFRAPVTFDREFTGVGLEPEWLDRPGPGGNPAILEVLERYASELSARLRRPKIHSPTASATGRCERSARGRSRSATRRGRSG